MIFPDIPELTIIGIYDRGIPNKERVVFKTNAWLNATEFGVMLGFLMPDNLAAPYIDHLYHFRDLNLAPSTWLFLYTGPGNDFDGKFPTTDDVYYVFHWGKQTTVFAHSNIVPVLFRIGGVQLGVPPLNLPQIEEQN